MQKRNVIIKPKCNQATYSAFFKQVVFIGISLLEWSCLQLTRCLAGLAIYTLCTNIFDTIGANYLSNFKSLGTAITDYNL